MKSQKANKQRKSNKYLLAGATVTAAAVIARPALAPKVFAANQHVWTKQVDLDRLGGDYASSAISASGSHLVLTVTEGGENTEQMSPVFISTNYGSSWENVADEMEEGVRNVWTSSDVSNNGQTMVVSSTEGFDTDSGPVEGRIFISGNSGDTWTDITPEDSGELYDYNEWRQVVVSGDGSKVAAVRADVGEVYVTENGGDTWTTVEVGEDVWNLKSISISDDGDKMLVGGENEDYATKQFFTDDNGDNWTDVSPNPEDGVYWSPSAMSASGDKIAVLTTSWDGEESVKLFVTENSGEDWEEVTPDEASGSGWSGVALSDDGSRLTTLHTDDGVFISDDFGASWSLDEPDVEYEETNDWNSIDINSNGTKAVVTSDDNAFLLGENIEEETPGEQVVTTSFTDAEGGKTVTLTTPAGTTVTCHSAVKESGLSSKDAGYIYPLGLVDFCFSTEDESNEVSIVFTTELKPNEVVARKYNPSTEKYDNVPGVSITETTQDGQHALRVTYTIVDNGPLDLDPDEGEISDPIGIASTLGSPNTGNQNVRDWLFTRRDN